MQFARDAPPCGNCELRHERQTRRSDL